MTNYSYLAVSLTFSQQVNEASMSPQEKQLPLLPMITFKLSSKIVKVNFGKSCIHYHELDNFTMLENLCNETGVILKN